MESSIYSYSLFIALPLMLLFGFYFLFGQTPKKAIFENYVRSRRIMGVAMLLLAANYSVHFFFEIRFKNENGKYFQIASPEKALCDKVYDMKTVSNIREMESLLTKDLRIDVDDLKKMDIDIIKEIAAAYPSTNVQLLSKFLKRVISS